MPLSAKGRAALGLALNGALLPCSARAVAKTCSAPSVTVELPPGEAWRTGPAQLGEHLRALRDLDKCARVSIRADAQGAILEISTSDGREATRRVANVAELLKAAEALLVLPPTMPAPPPPPMPISPEELPPDARLPNVVTPSVHVELGIGAALRFGSSPAYFAGGAAAFAEFALDRWLLAVTARYEITTALVNQPAPTDFVMQSSCVGVSAGRRLELGRVNVDGLVGPNVVLEDEHADDVVALLQRKGHDVIEMRRHFHDVDRELEGVAADFRLGATWRVSGPPSSSVRPFASGDLEISPLRIHSAKSLDRALPPLPSWTTGVALGVLWGAR